MTRFERGEPIVMRSIVPAEQPGSPLHVDFTYAAIAIEDTTDAVATWQSPGGVVMERTGARQPNGRLMLPNGWDGGYAPREWSGDGVVRVHSPGEEWSVWRWLGENRTWGRWFYVNLEDPWRRSRFGFDSNDWILDLLVERDRLAVRFKDEDELDWSLGNGLVTPDQARHIRAAGARAHTLALSDGWPFSANWDRWLPDPTWAIPSLPSDWNTLD